MRREPIHSFAVLRNRLRVSGALVALTALRVGAGRSNSIGASQNGVVPTDLPVLRDATGAPFVPGASLKGVLRAQIEGLLRAAIPAEPPDFKKIEELKPHLIEKLESPGPALDFEELEQRTAAIGKFKLKNRDLPDEQLSQLIWRTSTLVDLTFGSPQVAGRLFLKDALVDRTLWFDQRQYEIRNGVALNRDTETVEKGLLYDYEVVPAGTRFHFALVLENAAAWQLGMLLLALRPWERGEVQIGGFRSRGLGYVQLEPSLKRFDQLRHGHPDDVLALLRAEGEPQSNITDQQIEAWVKEFRAVLMNPKLALDEGGTNA